jgi:hypothetical protein
MLLLAMTLGAPAADDKTYVLKIALATLDDALHQYAKNYAAAVEKLCCWPPIHSLRFIAIDRCSALAALNLWRVSVRMLTEPRL